MLGRSSFLPESLVQRMEFGHHLAKEERIQMGVDLDRLGAGKA
jgi:hypothetical protein